LIAPVVDPISGQPELKCAPVRVRRYKPKSYGFALSREPHASSFPTSRVAATAARMSRATRCLFVAAAKSLPSRRIGGPR
jgi:hypothetical protein